MKKIAPFVILFVVSIFAIFYLGASIPKNLTFDELDFSKLALSLQNKPYTPYSTFATGHSTLYFYIILASFKIFGVSKFALRLPAAIFGVFSVLLFYSILKIVFRDKKILNLLAPASTYYLILTTLILLTSHWFLNFARFSFEVTFLLFLELVSIYFLISKKSLFISGLFSGLAFLSYTPGRIFFLLPLFFIFIKNKGQVQDQPLQKKLQQFNNATIKQIMLFIVPFLIIITPLSSYLLTHNDTRIDQQLFLKNKDLTLQQKLNGLWSNVSSTALMFNFKGDPNGRHNYPNKPALNPALGLLFIIGLVIAIKQWNNNYDKLFLFYFLISLFPALMTYPWENPNMLRTYTTLPSVVYFASLAIYHLGTIVSRLSSNKRIFKYLILTTFYLLLVLSCVYELRTYFVFQPLVFKQSFDQPEYLLHFSKNENTKK